jgi:hypothetical protein
LKEVILISAKLKGGEGTGSFIVKKRNKGRLFMQPDVSEYMLAWYVWGGLIIGTFLMTVIGTWLIARGWDK